MTGDRGIFSSCDKDLSCFVWVLLGDRLVGDNKGNSSGMTRTPLLGVNVFFGDPGSFFGDAVTLFRDDGSLLGILFGAGESVTSASDLLRLTAARLAPPALLLFLLLNDFGRFFVRCTRLELVAVERGK